MLECGLRTGPVQCVCECVVCVRSCACVSGTGGGKVRDLSDLFAQFPISPELSNLHTLCAQLIQRAKCRRTLLQFSEERFLFYLTFKQDI